MAGGAAGIRVDIEETDSIAWVKKGKCKECFREATTGEGVLCKKRDALVFGKEKDDGVVETVEFKVVFGRSEIDKGRLKF